MHATRRRCDRVPGVARIVTADFDAPTSSQYPSPEFAEVSEDEDIYVKLMYPID